MTGQVPLWKVKASMSMDRTWAEHSWPCANRIKNESEVAEGSGFQVREWDEEGGTCFSCPFPHPTLPPPNSRCFFLPPHISPLCWSLHSFWGSDSSSFLMYLSLSLLGGSRWPGHPWRRNGPSEGFGPEPLQAGLLSGECDKHVLGSFLNWRPVDIQCCVNYCHITKWFS